MIIPKIPQFYLDIRKIARRAYRWLTPTWSEATCWGDKTTKSLARRACL